MKETQVLVIGAGPGGYVCAIKLAKLGKKVLLVDKDKLGGECLNYGCIPSKALIHAAGLAAKIQKASQVGIVPGDLKVNWAQAVQWKAGLVGGLTRGIGALTKGNGVEVLMGEARFTGAHEAEVKSAAGTEAVRFEHAVIVSGSRPMAIPGFAFDGQNVLSSKEALDLTEAPGRLAVIGGGVIGLEIGTFFAKLGSKVSVVEALDRILPTLETDMTAPVARSLQKLGVETHLSAKALGYEKTADGLALRVQTPEGEKAILADKILLAVGRTPNADALNLEAAGVRRDPKGFIPVSESLATSAPHIYAVGDVIGPPYLAHKASREGILAAQAIAGGHAEARGPVPWAVFTDPEVSYVGETEAELKARGAEFQMGRFPFSASGRALSTRETDGFVKILAEKGTGRVLGVGIAGPNASDLIGEACLALRMKATVEDIANTIHPHPTLCEALQEAAEACMGQAIHILAPARR
ncbi:MAG TPA: dihydrolipoyl dehydrogenase [Elusimicrobiota bacterium]|jgi:dihydrolipoamide dehydrogenase|nr:dihydrolipoyl dehydrogenase [Elusimicrobiota bacterium]